MSDESYSMRAVLYHHVRKKHSFYRLSLIAHRVQYAVSITRHNDFLDKGMGWTSLRAESRMPLGRKECGVDIVLHRKSNDHRQKKS